MLLTGELPGGYWDPAGRLHRDFELDVLTGREEELLAAPRRAGTAALVTEVLAHCLRRVGDIAPVPPAATRRMLVADRHYLLAQLRIATFGDVVRGSLACPRPECGARVGFDFAMSDLPVDQQTVRAPRYTLPGSDVSFRLPNGADEEAAVDGEALVARCVRRSGDEPEVPAPVLAAVAERMRALAPRIESTMELACTECGRSFEAPFDVARFVLGELRGHGGLLYQEVHYLAYHYKWSEHDILALTRDKRRMYIDLLASAMAEVGDGPEAAGSPVVTRPAEWAVPAGASLPWPTPVMPPPAGPAADVLSTVDGVGLVGATPARDVSTVDDVVRVGMPPAGTVSADGASVAAAMPLPTVSVDGGSVAAALPTVPVDGASVPGAMSLPAGTVPVVDGEGVAGAPLPVGFASVAGGADVVGAATSETKSIVDGEIVVGQAPLPAEVVPVVDGERALGAKPLPAGVVPVVDGVSVPAGAVTASGRDSSRLGPVAASRLEVSATQSHSGAVPVVDDATSVTGRPTEPLSAAALVAVGLPMSPLAPEALAPQALVPEPVVPASIVPPLVRGRREAPAPTPREAAEPEAVRASPSRREEQGAARRSAAYQGTPAFWERRYLGRWSGGVAR